MAELYTYFRSSTAYRVRIALNLKGVDYDPKFVHLVKNEQKSAVHKKLNPSQAVPVFKDGDWVLTQSMAILEYLDETHPEPALLPTDAKGRARVRQLANIIACDIHPVANLRVLKYLENELHVDKSEKLAWYRHWVEEGLSALEQLVKNNPSTGTYCHGDAVTLADICLVPQLYNAKRFDCNAKKYPTLVKIGQRLEKLPAFKAAAPENQPDCDV